MSSSSNNQGRAYEYICLLTLNEEISKKRPCCIIKNSSYIASSLAWDTLSVEDKVMYTQSARSTISTIFSMEPNIVEETEDLLELYIQDDRKGELADVRDIIIKRNEIIWEIGLSIKHNHTAVKHSRLAKTLDFGLKWYHVPCSQMYWNEVKPIFEFLEEEKNKGTYFRDLISKEDQIYIPLLKAFIKEIESQVSKDASIPRKMVEYLLSKYDFYKIISLDSQRITTIQSFNMYGTLNQASRTKSPDIIVPPLDLPNNLLYINLKPNSKTTAIMCFDNGWQFTFRIHNAMDIVEPSLKFDIQIKGMPTDVHIKYNCKWAE